MPAIKATTASAAGRLALSVKTYFLHVFSRFFDLKIVSDVIVVKNMNGDFGEKHFGVKKRVCLCS